MNGECSLTASHVVDFFFFFKRKEEKGVGVGSVGAGDWKKSRVQNVSFKTRETHKFNFLFLKKKKAGIKKPPLFFWEPGKRGGGGGVLGTRVIGISVYHGRSCDIEEQHFGLGLKTSLVRCRSRLSPVIQDNLLCNGAQITVD